MTLVIRLALHNRDAGRVESKFGRLQSAAFIGALA